MAGGMGGAVSGAPDKYDNKGLGKAVRGWIKKSKNKHRSNK